MSRSSILIVDDQKSVRALLFEIARKTGFGSIFEADALDIAQHIMKSNVLDLVMIDWVLADDDGLDFVKWVRRSGECRTPHAPIIMVTGKNHEADIIKARDAGVNDYVAKPFSIKRLLQRIHACRQDTRPFVTNQYFIGPCRRRSDKLEYKGRERRGREERATRYHR